MNPLSDLPVYFISKLPHAQLAALSPVQLLAQAHLGQIHTLWWLTYTATLSYVFSRFLFLPLLAKWRKPAKSRKA